MFEGIFHHHKIDVLSMLPSELIAVNELYLRVMKMTASILHLICSVRGEPQHCEKSPAYDLLQS